MEPNVDIMAPITNIIILTPHLHCKSVISYNLGLVLSFRQAGSQQPGRWEDGDWNSTESTESTFAKINLSPGESCPSQTQGTQNNQIKRKVSTKKTCLIN